MIALQVASAGGILKGEHFWCHEIGYEAYFRVMFRHECALKYHYMFKMSFTPAPGHTTILLFLWDVAIGVYFAHMNYVSNRMRRDNTIRLYMHAFSAIISHFRVTPYA